MIDTRHGWVVSYKPQFIGFVMSVIITVAAYRIVAYKELSDLVLTLTIFGLAFFQALIQLIFMLHLGLETKPRWALITFLFTVFTLVIIVGGTLWIMSNLNYNLMPPMQKSG